jgi:uncharacterized repeat protein (TIGR03803 family)
MKGVSLIGLIITACLCTSATQGATALYEEVFADIGAGNTGMFPNGRLVQASDGNFYGTSQQGGVKIGGTAFRLTPGGKLSSIYSFDLRPNDLGIAPHAAFCVGADGNLFGTTTKDSCNRAGCIFKMTVKGEPTFLQCNYPGDLAPVSYTQFTRARDGTFYAALYDLDSRKPYLVGFVSHLGRDGSVLFSTQMNRAAHGAEPKAPLTEGTDGNVYGVASQGGANELGTMFRVSPAGVITLLHSFAGSDGSKPESALIQASDGNFYGTTTRGGKFDMGTIFRATTTGRVATLKSFNGVNGSYPDGGLTIGPNGFLYGTTNAGGQTNDGTFYQITLQGSFTTLASFNAATTGRVPSNGVTLGRDGKFYGTTVIGGDYGYGTAYRATSAGVLTRLASLGDPEGYYAENGVIEGKDGNLYGGASAGGNNYFGTIFKIAPNGKVSTLASFDQSTTGYVPTPIVQGTDGNFYGATMGGGANGVGAIFKATRTGVFTVVAPLNTTTGSNPFDFLLGQDGNFYTLTGAGGPSLGGTILRLTSSGALSQFAALTIGPLGGSYFRFMQDADGSFYGTASQTPNQPDGLAFKVNASGTQSTLANFASFDQGELPAGGLTRGLNGNFYGTTLFGGVPGNGVVFRLTPIGALSVVHTFTPTEANGSAGRLLRMADGSFFGTTFQNSNNDAPGLLFRVTAGGLFQKWPVFDGLHGSFPKGALTLASDGYIYGTTEQGGIAGGGVVYRFTSSPPQVSQFSPTSGQPGQAVVLTGRYLAGTSSVTFNATSASKFTINSSGQITAIVPKGAATGPITITNPLGTASTNIFTVL